MSMSSTSKRRSDCSWETPIPPFRHGGDDEDLARSFEESLRVSREIDEQLLETKKELEKKKRCVQVLLLGQSESGKSSILRNFELTFAPKEFERERPAWKTIVQLNLIGSVKVILDNLQQEWSRNNSTDKPILHRDLRRMQLGLSPLLFMEQKITRLLLPGDHGHQGVCVRPGSNWKALLNPEADSNGQKNPLLNKDTDPTTVLMASKDNILSLWNDPSVRAVLRKHGVRMEDTPGFFLNDIERIVSPNYQPSDSDIMRARIKTLGVEEHRFVVEKGFDVGSEVYITDVGGSRSQRPRWIPYFQDVQTILFLAPLSFNQALEEDPETNRLEDSLMLWREICRNKILAPATLILLFNKKDVLRSTLAAGIKVRKYVPSYGDLPNEVASVTKYFCDKFHAYHRKLSPVPRPFIFHETSAIDTSAMAALLLGETIRDTILRIYLQRGEMI